MRAFIPIDITDAMLMSSTIAEPYASEPAWSAATTYAAGDLVSVVTTDSHLLYESLVGSNLNNPPATSEAHWILKSYTNRFRMFEWNQGDASTAESPISVVLRPGTRIDSICLEGMQASTVEIIVTNGVGGDVVYTYDADLLVRNVTSFFEFYFSPFLYKKTIVTFNIPPVPDPVVTINLYDPSGTVSVSRIACGLSIYLGQIKWDPVSDSDNYSEIVWDSFGKAKLTPVPSVPVTEQKVIVDINRVNLVRQFRDQVNAKASVWSGIDDMEYGYTESLILIGVYRNFRINIPNPSYAEVNLTLKGI